MILVNREPISFTQFPDGTTSFRYDTGDACWFRIEWRYDGDHECMLLWYLVHHIRANKRQNIDIELILPYIPNARMDRVKSGDEVFTLKWFAEFINSLNFSKVVVLDPHSNVATALINRICVMESGDNIRLAIKCVQADTGNDDVLMCYPDEGAAKRYSDLMGREYVFGIKHRDWRTGEIEGLELANRDKVAGRNVLIVDDICSRGGTFTHTAAALKEAGAMQNIQSFLMDNSEVPEVYDVTQPSILDAIGKTGIRRATVIRDYAFTVTTRQDRTPAQVIDCGNGRYRYLTELECWRLQGYTDEDYRKAELAQNRVGRYYMALYKQAGNSIAVPIFESIFRKILLGETAA